MIEKQLKKYRVDHLYYMTPLENATSILEWGILSYNRVKNLPHCSFADEYIQRRRTVILGTGKRIHDYVPLYFATHTPMQYILTTPAPTKGRDRALSQEDLVFIEVNANKVFRLDGVFFTDGNAASKYTNFYSDLADLSQLDWHGIQLPNEYPQCYDSEFQRKKSSEVLVPEFIPAEFFDGVVVYTRAASRFLESQVNCHCSIGRSYYF